MASTSRREAILLRRAVEGDLTKVDEVLRSCCQRSSERHWDELDPNVETFREALQAQNLYIAAVPAHSVAGALAINAHRVPSPSIGTITVVHRLIVHPRCQRQGVARFLLQFAEAWARRAGSDVIRIAISAGNVPALRLCAGLGYHEAKPPQRGRSIAGCFEKVLA